MIISLNITCTIRPYSGGSDIFIDHEGKRYYSRVNYIMSNSIAMQNQCINQFIQRNRNR